MNKLIIGLALTLAMAFGSVAQQYEYTTLLSATGAGEGVIPGGAATNLAASVTLTKETEFVLALHWDGTNATQTSTLGVTCAWQTSADGVNWGTVVDGKNAGWFTIPTTNSVSHNWSTNITVNTVGYWRLNWMTNGAVSMWTNGWIRAYKKPVGN